MPRALASAVRKAIWKRSQSGKHPSEIAAEFHVSERSVRRLIADIESRGKEALQASYDACGVRRSKEYKKHRQRTLKLRQQHSKWGAGRLLLELAELYPQDELPCKRTLERWLHQERIPPAPAGRPSAPAKARADAPHKVWQVDAAEQKRLASGKMISWLRIADECSGAVLKTIVFSRRPLHARSSAKGAKSFEGGFYGVGLARDVASGQRRTLGIVERFAPGTFLVGDRSGSPDALERPLSSAAKWSHRTDARLGENLGRTRPMPNGATVSKSYQARGSAAAGSVSRDRRCATPDGLSLVETLWPSIQPQLGATTLGLGFDTRSSGWLRRAEEGRQLGKDWHLRWQALRRRDPQETFGVRAARSRTSRMGCQRRTRPAASHRKSQRVDTTCRTHAEPHTYVARVSGQTSCHHFWTMGVAC